MASKLDAKSGESHPDRQAMRRSRISNYQNLCQSSWNTGSLGLNLESWDGVRKSRRSRTISTFLPQSSEHVSRIETTSKVGSYGATLVVGILGFVLGNLALDAIKEQIHHSSIQSLSQSAPGSPPPLATQSGPRPPAIPQSAPSGLPPPSPQSEATTPAVPQPALAGPPSLATESEPRPLAERSEPLGQFGEHPAQVSQQEPEAPMKSLPPALGPVGQIIHPNSAIGDASAAGKGAPNQAISVRLNPKLAKAYFGRGVAYGQTGSFDTAIDELTEAIRLDPTLALAYCGRGSAYGHKGNHDRAIADFNQAIRLDPRLAVAYYGRGCAYWYYGQKAKAEEDFVHAKRLGYTSPRPSSTNFIQMSLSALVGVKLPP
jgi:hypothetical protein